MVFIALKKSFSDWIIVFWPQLLIFFQSDY